MKNLKIIFIHGNDAMRWSYSWTPWLKKELEKLNLNVIFETFPDSIEAREKYWIPFLEQNLKADENTLIIGHSTGAIAAMRYAQKNTIFGSILISPYHTHLGIEDEKASGWFDKEWRWDNIKNNQKQIGIFYSKDDNAIPLKEFLHVKEKLNPNYIYEFEDKGHFIKQNTFPEVLECVKKMIEK